MKLIITGTLLLIASITCYSQRYLSELDSSLFIRDTIRPFLQRFENLRFTGYIQPQFQMAQAEGAKTFEGGDFSQFSKSRFMLRRARIRLDYFIPSKKNRWPRALFSFQVDATERGVNVRDMFIRLFENKYHNFSLTAGLFARPFGYEVNLSSAYRETPERGRMSQILMPSERDLGAMISFEPQNQKSKLAFLKVDAGLFNGQGLSGSTDFDSHKDFISRITIKPLKVKQFEISGGISLMHGGWRQATKYIYKIQTTATGDNYFGIDSSEKNIGKITSRHYYGADIQLKLNHAWGATEWRAEYWTGKQPGTSSSSANPGVLPTGPTYIRYFDGAFFYFLQNIINSKHQLVLKYDWYDPNKKIKEDEIGKNGNNLNATDIKYSTFGFGYVYYFNNNVKLTLYYDIVKNKSALLAGYTSDFKDNVFNCRVQFRF